MPVLAVVGANWGDEGKGKMTDALAAEAEVVVRFQGGRNAGHTVIHDGGKFVLHLLPCGVFHPGVTSVLGPGVALDLEAFFSELDMLEERGLPKPQVVVSDRAQVVLPYHALLDRCEEERLGEARFGSTQVGIAPFYADKYLKLGVQAADLAFPDRVRERLASALVLKNALLAHVYGRAPLDIDAVLDQTLRFSRRLLPYLADTTALLGKTLAQGRTILLEGQLGALRDPDHGIYPYVSSSSPLAGFGCVGAGLPPQAITRVLAVTKAYATCVGAGPFVTEIHGPEAEALRARGGDAGEYGATTGRPRRMGWFDAVATRYGCQVQGATEAALTMLDALQGLDKIPVCTAYDLGGKRTDRFPPAAYLENARPVYSYLPGWSEDVSAARTLDALPEAARRYIKTLEKMIGCPVGWVSVGPHREALIRV
jgi:adenylosuccinate synthase